MELYAGLDLHSRNTYIGILDQNLKRVFKKRVITWILHESIRMSLAQNILINPFPLAAQ
jgi:hypothetical protein